MKKILLMTLILFSTSFVFAETVNVKVKGMVCSFCAQGLIKKFKAEPNVKDVKVSLKEKNVRISLKGDETITDQKIKEIVSYAGYDVEDIKRQ